MQVALCLCDYVWQKLLQGLCLHHRAGVCELFYAKLCPPHNVLKGKEAFEAASLCMAPEPVLHDGMSLAIGNKTGNKEDCLVLR